MVRLPLRSEIHLDQRFLTVEEADHLFAHLSANARLTDGLRVSGARSVQMATGKLMLVDESRYAAGTFPEAQWGPVEVWSEAMGELRRRVERLAGSEFPVGVCIYYPDGRTGIDFHRDLVAFGDTDLIASLSLGARREFALRDVETGAVFRQPLDHGSLLLLGPGTQTIYEHALVLDPQCTTPRINVTFRRYGFS